MAHALSGHWPFGKSKLDLKQSSLRQARSSDLKFSSWLAELVKILVLYPRLKISKQAFELVVLVQLQPFALLLFNIYLLYFNVLEKSSNFPTKGHLS